MGLNCDNCKNENDLQKTNCNHTLCEECIDKIDDKLCPICKEDIDICVSCLMTIVEKNNLLPCKHPLCKDCIPKMHSTVCPCCRQEINSDFFPTGVKDDIENRIKEDKIKEDIEYETKLILSNNLIYLISFIPRNIIIKFIDSFILFYHNYDIPNDKIKYVRDKYIAFIFKSRDNIYDDYSVEYILGEFIILYIENQLDTIEDINENNIPNINNPYSNIFSLLSRLSELRNNLNNNELFTVSFVHDQNNLNNDNDENNMEENDIEENEDNNYDIHTENINLYNNLLVNNIFNRIIRNNDNDNNINQNNNIENNNDDDDENKLEDKTEIVVSNEITDDNKNNIVVEEDKEENNVKIRTIIKKSNRNN